jgi:hypothetical protein
LPPCLAGRRLHAVLGSVWDSGSRTPVSGSS